MSDETDVLAQFEKDRRSLRGRLHRLKYRLEGRKYRLQEQLTRRFPRLANEGSATARAIDYTFDGFPLEENYQDKAEAVSHLQLIWDIMDDWGDGRRVNVERAQQGLGEIYQSYMGSYAQRRKAEHAGDQGVAPIATSE
jgi:hypothetical protein